MKGQRFVYWQDGQFWLGYLEEFPDCLTQGESLKDLKSHLRDLYRDLTSGAIPQAAPKLSKPLTIKAETGFLPSRKQPSANVHC